MNKYEAVIGIETHVQIRTKSKMFCSCPNTYGALPNTQTCPICMGMPGVLPVLNQEAVHKAIVAGLMCECEIALFSKFDRKSYFYPDLVKGYQITQYDLPICKNGKIHIGGMGLSGERLPDKVIGMTRMHLEEDPGKSTHYVNCTGLDYNRSGVPLIEIVSEPDMRSADEAYAYLSALKEIMQYADVSDCDMEKGQMRCDVNISLRPIGRKEFGTKVEIKNLNSFRAAHRAIQYEIKRQLIELENGNAIEQDTRGWNDDLGETIVQRTKENANDYRYFPEPDLLPVRFSQDEIDSIRKNLPELPRHKRKRYVAELSLTEYDAQVLTSEKKYAEYFEKAIVNAPELAKNVANLFASELLRLLGETSSSLEDCKIQPESLTSLAKLIVNSTINSKTAKQVFAEMFETGKSPEVIVKEKNLVQVTDENAILTVVKEVIEQNSEQVRQYREGKTAVLQYFVGQVMKRSKGKANPKIALELIKKSLDA